MKKQILLVMVAVFMTLNGAFGQVWFNENAVWDYSSTVWIQTSSNIVSILKDTLVQDINCKFLSGTSNAFNLINASSIVYESNDSVFYYKNGNFVLMYNFNMISGDTMHLNDQQCSSNQYMVLDSIVEMQIGTETRRVQYMDVTSFNYGHHKTTIIEGIGMAYINGGHTWAYLVPDILYECIFDLGWDFCSFSDDFINYDPLEKCAYEIVPTKEPHFASQVIISPNPSSHHITLSYPTDIKLLKASLLSTTGATLFTKENPSNELTLDTEMTGLFFLKLEFEEGIIMKKIIRN